MIAERELDALVAEKVFGWQWYTFLHTSYILPPNAEERGIIYGLDSYGWQSGKNGEPDYENSRLDSIRHWVVGRFSTDIADALRVVEKVRATVLVEVEFQLCAYEDGTWSAEFGIEGGEYADTAPEAIVRAALAYVGALPTEGDGT